MVSSRESQRCTARAWPALMLVAGCASNPTKALDVTSEFAGGGEGALAIHCTKLFTMDAQDRVFTPGTLLLRDGVIEYAGERMATPSGYVELDTGLWAFPGLVDLHTHIHTGRWGARDEINDSLLPINVDLSVAPTFDVSNRWMQAAAAGGVTTLFGIPGSGSSISGFGVLYKPKVDSTFEESVLADPGGMKVAQTHNPERFGDLGATRAGLAWMLRDINDKARAAFEQGRFDPDLDNLARVHAKELPVLIHTAAEGVANTASMWRGEYDTRSVLSHGSFDGWKQAPYVAAMGMPVNHGPRTTDFFSTRDGRIVNTAKEFVDAGVPNFSLNTDSRIVPEHEFWLQGTVSARLGLDGYQMLRALTIHPARAFGIDDRVGSLEAGKHADVILHSGNLLDPRERVEMLLIDGEVEYSRARDGQWF